MKNNIENKNIIYLRNKEKYDKASEHTKKLIDEFKQQDPYEYQLIKFKRSKEQVNEGDVFVLKTHQNIYLYGRVLQRIRNNKSSFMDNSILAVIFSKGNKEINYEFSDFDYNDLIINPFIVKEFYWHKGYFKKISNIPLKTEEKNLDIGFYNSIFDKFYKANGDTIDHMPKLLGLYGIKTEIGIAGAIEMELIYNPKLLEVE